MNVQRVGTARVQNVSWRQCVYMRGGVCMVYSRRAGACTTCQHVRRSVDNTQGGA